eukprot:gene11999-5399_t
MEHDELKKKAEQEKEKYDHQMKLMNEEHINLQKAIESDKKKHEELAKMKKDQDKKIEDLKGRNEELRHQMIVSAKK